TPIIRENGLGVKANPVFGGSSGSAPGGDSTVRERALALSAACAKIASLRNCRFLQTAYRGE
ncbi:MAG: hypothetical protein JSW27_06270, partial [Phycisphaerales bacterium]